LKPRGLPYATLALGALSLFIPFFNYGLSGDLTGGDAGVAWALPNESLRAVLGVYLDSPGLGYNGATGLAAAFPALALASLLHALHLSTAIVARLITALYFFLAMSGALKLFEAVLPKDRLGRGAAFLAALFYGVNRYTVLLYFTAQTYFPMLYSALPWLLYGVIEGCERNRRFGIAIVVAGLIWAGGAGSNPALFAVAIGALVAGGIFELAQGVPARRVLAVVGIGTSLGVLCCAWWILPLATSLGVGLEAVSYQSVPSWAQWMSERSSFLNLFKLDGYTGADTLPFAQWYASPLGSALGYVPLAVGIAGFGVYRRRFSAVVLVALAVAAFLSKGVHPPFGDVYVALLQHIPGFSIFRSPFVKWIGLEAMLLALFFALGLAGMGARLRRLARGRRAALLCLGVASAAAVVAYPWVAYTGRMLSPTLNGAGFLSRMPQAYSDITAILSRDAHGARTIVFGGGAPPYPLYTWGYFGDDPLTVAVGSPVDRFESLVPNAPQMSSRELAAALRALGAAFVVVHHDVRNPLPSPQADVLVASGAATTIYRSPVLDLLRLRDPADPLFGLVHVPLVAQSNAGAIPDDRPSGGLPGTFDPNLGFLLPGGPLAVLVPLPGAPFADPQLNSLGWIRDVTDAPMEAPPGADVAFVPANPLAVLLQRRRCGVREGIHLASPVQWHIAEHDLGAVSSTLCWAGRRVGQFYIGGNLPNQLSRAISLVNGRPLAIDAPISGAPTIVGRRLLRSGLPFEVHVPKGTDLLEFILPPIAGDATFSVVLKTASGQEAGTGGQSISNVVVVRLSGPTPADEDLLAYLRSSDPSVYVALQDMQTIGVSTAAPSLQRLWLDIDQRLLQSISLTTRELAVPSRASNVQQLPGARPNAGLSWAPDSGTAVSQWSERAGVIHLSSAGPPTEVHAQGSIAANSRYRFAFDYRATGFAELWTRTGGADVDRITHLIADGREHRFVGRVFPPAGSDGWYILRIRSSGGAIEVRNASLAMEGPNGLIVAWRKGTALGGSVVRWERPHPWLFDAVVTDCAPCALRVGVSDPGNWRVQGANVQGTFTSQGGSGGSWGLVTSGAATWLIDAGTGTRTIRIIFWPAVVAAIGLIVSLAAVLLGALLLFVRPAKRGNAVERDARLEPQRSSTPSVLLLILACAAIAIAIVGGLASSAGEEAADVLWGALLAVGVFEWLRPVPRVAPRPLQ